MLFPDEYYNPFSSRARVHQAVKLLSRWLEHSSLPLKIEAGPTGYRLIAQSPCHIMVGGHTPDRSRLALEKLRVKWGQSPFTAKQAGELLQLPHMSTHRLLRQALQQGCLVKLGQAKNTRYAFLTDDLNEQSAGVIDNTHFLLKA